MCKRKYKNLDDQVNINNRNLKMVLRRLRKLTREGNKEEFDLNNTISSTAKNAGLLDIKYRSEKKNSVRVLLLIDIGGSMDDHAKDCEEVFSAAKSEFKSLKNVTYCKNISLACLKADLVILHTEWNDFKLLNFKKLIKKNKFKIYDLRNLYSPQKMKRQKIQYYSVGR